ncbi:hypothetical protein [Bradyrhizobium uaiense]|nr:hypothetical protein [Bradyrhizobium uaiense]
MKVSKLKKFDVVEHLGTLEARAKYLTPVAFQTKSVTPLISSPEHRA